MGNSFDSREKHSTSVSSVGLSTAHLTVIAGFHRHIFENKIRNHLINEVKNLGYDR